MSNYYSPGRERLAKQIMKLRGEGWDRGDIVAELEQQGHPNEWVLVDSIFDAPIPERVRKAYREESRRARD